MIGKSKEEIWRLQHGWGRLLPEVVPARINTKHSCFKFCIVVTPSQVLDTELALAFCCGGVGNSFFGRSGVEMRSCLSP